MVNFMNLPTVQAPRNALMDFAPVTQAIDGNRRNALMQLESQRQDEELGMRKSQFEYQQSRDKKQDARADESYFAKGAESVKNMDPADPRRSMVWQNLLQKHPGRASLTPDYLDPVKGPEMVLAEYGALKDPRESKLKDLEIRKTEAQIDKLQREPAGGEAPSSVREYEYFNRLSPEQKTQYLTMKRAEKYLDMGPSFVRPNPMDPTAQPLATINKNLADAEAQKELGTALGKQAASAPGDIDSAETALELVDSLRTDPNRAAGTSIVSPVGNVIPKTPGYAYQKKVDQAKAGAFMTAIQQLRGMGALSNSEGQTGTAAVTRMDTATNDADFENALKDYEAIIMRGQRNARRNLKERERLLKREPTVSQPQAMPNKMDLGDGFTVEVE